MIGFVMIGVNDLKESSKFYDIVLSELNIKKNISTDRYIGYSEKNTPEKIEFYITKPYNKEVSSNGNGTMIALLANSRNQVNKFHAVALLNGALNEGSPGPRPSDETNYYSYNRDLNGNKICVFCTSKD
jgi:predicted lactoylglutathione lyase